MINVKYEITLIKSKLNVSVAIPTLFSSEEAAKFTSLPLKRVKTTTECENS